LERGEGSQQKQAQIDDRQQANEKTEYVFNGFDTTCVMFFNTQRYKEGRKLQKKTSFSFVFLSFLRIFASNNH
jgi:hypothetical protein